MRPLNVIRETFNITLASESVDCPDFERNLDRLTHSRLIGGNSVEILENGEEAYPSMLRDINNAQVRIGLSVYDFKSDKTGIKFINALKEAALRGVEVRVLYDRFGSQDIEFADFEPLIEAGGMVRIFNPYNNWTILRKNNRAHRKILIVDGKTAYMGGLNIADKFAGNGHNSWRDTAVRVQGPVTYEVTKVFADTWNQAGTNWFGKNPPFLVGLNWLKRAIDTPFIYAFNLDYIPPKDNLENCGDKKLRVVSQAPEWLDSYILNMYIIAANSAKKSLYIATPYFLPPELLNRALINAAKRGVDVRIMTHSERMNDVKIAFELSTGYFEDLIAAGAKIYGWEKSNLHAKIMIVDGKWSSVGSCNFDGRALLMNYEANFGISDPEISSKLSKRFLEDAEISYKYTLEEAKKMHTFKQLLLKPIEGQF